MCEVIVDICYLHVIYINLFNRNEEITLILVQKEVNIWTYAYISTCYVMHKEQCYGSNWNAKSTMITGC